MRSTFPIAIVSFVGCAQLAQTNATVDGRNVSADVPVAYHCKSGHTVNASYHSGTTAVVRYEGRTREMTVAISGSGARYFGGGLKCVTKDMVFSKPYQAFDY